ncbi:MAG: hypothetical protein KDA21_10550, partial [Phycisphaerales bacterium]|nr:hypothetical protein [Phycisphaerales bacterium]
IFITGGNQFFPISLETLRVGGSLDRTNIHTNGNIEVVEMRGMFDSVLMAGGPNTQYQFPSSANGFNNFATLPSVTVSGVGQGASSFVNSVIAARFLGDVRITLPDISNALPFGLAATRIDSVTTTFADGVEVLDPATTSMAWGDYQVRVGFVVPT